jgi:hypothetical protein
VDASASATPPGKVSKDFFRHLISYESSATLQETTFRHPSEFTPISITWWTQLALRPEALKSVEEVLA